MAQATRNPRTSPGASAPLSDDPIESATTWLQLNSKPILLVVGGAAVAAAAVMIYRSNMAATREKASVALYEAQAPFVQGKLPEAQEKALGGASPEFKSNIEALIAAGYEQKKDMVKAAEHYGKAASLAPYKSEKYNHQASQARSLMAAGKNADAKKIWEELAKLEGEPVQQEATVRLGELAAKS
jgi:tetratricopeptide (TPR) repeat protein